MTLYLFVCGGNGCLCKMGILRGRFHALSSAGKMEDWTGYIFSLLSRRIFYIIFNFFTVLHSEAIHRDHDTPAGVMSSLASINVCFLGLFLLLSMRC